MSARSESELRSLLLARAAELTGHPAERLVDGDGDVVLSDGTFNVWGRILPDSSSGQFRLVFVMAPLLELEPSQELAHFLTQTLSGQSIYPEFGNDAVWLFGPTSTTVLERTESFRETFASMVAVGMTVIAAVQPQFGGLTPAQRRALLGWRGHDAGIEADLRDILGPGGGDLLAHGWNPRSESLPLLVTEEDVPDGWVKRFVTVDADGAVRFRSSVPGVRDGDRGVALTIHRLDPDAARAWAGRVGIEVRDGKLRVEDVLTLAGRPWQDLMDATNDLPRQFGDAWEPRR